MRILGLIVSVIGSSLVILYLGLWIWMSYYMTPPVLHRITTSIVADRTIRPEIRETVTLKVKKGRTLTLHSKSASEAEKAAMREWVTYYSDQLEASRITIEFDLN